MCHWPSSYAGFVDEADSALVVVVEDVGEARRLVVIMEAELDGVEAWVRRGVVDVGVDDPTSNVGNEEEAAVEVDDIEEADVLVEEAFADKEEVDGEMLEVVIVGWAVEKLCDEETETGSELLEAGLVGTLAEGASAEAVETAFELLDGCRVDALEDVLDGSGAGTTTVTGGELTLTIEIAGVCVVVTSTVFVVS